MTRLLSTQGRGPGSSPIPIRTHGDTREGHMDRWNDSLERVLATLVAAERIAVETLGVPFRPIALIRVIEDTPGSHIGRYRKRDELKALGFIDAVVTPGQPTRWTVTNLGIAIAGDATPLKTDAQLLATLRRP